jgi:hypothetical protein
MEERKASLQNDLWMQVLHGGESHAFRDEVYVVGR